MDVDLVFLQIKKRCVLAEQLAHQQLERAFGTLKLVALMLKVFEVIENALGLGRILVQ